MTTCQWIGCEEIVSEPCARGRLPLNPAGSGPVVEVDLYLCSKHRIVIENGATAGVSIAVEPQPARGFR